MKLDAVEPITNDVLDKIKEHYKTKEGYYINDHLSHGEERYFLIRKNHYSENNNYGTEISIIWIGPNIWQYNYMNPECTNRSEWKSPLEFVNELIKDI
jgi:hypothetical protein